MLIRQESIKTAGIYLLHNNRFAFMIGPDKSGESLGIVRLGGHVEDKEDIISCVRREVREEASADIILEPSPITYYKTSWETELYTVIDGSDCHHPLIVCGNEERATVLHLAYTEDPIKPSSEAYGIILLTIEEMEKLCGNEITLDQFVRQGGKLLQNKEMDFGIKLKAGPHLRFLNQLIQGDNYVIQDFIKSLFNFSREGNQ